MTAEEEAVTVALENAVLEFTVIPAVFPEVAALAIEYSLLPLPLVPGIIILAIEFPIAIRHAILHRSKVFAPKLIGCREHTGLCYNF